VALLLFCAQETYLAQLQELVIRKEPALIATFLTEVALLQVTPGTTLGLGLSYGQGRAACVVQD